MRRVAPRTVLLDAREPALRDAAVLGPALMRGATCALFGTAEATRDLRVFAAQARVTLVVIPDDLDRLGELMSRPVDAERRTER